MQKDVLFVKYSGMIRIASRSQTRRLVVLALVIFLVAPIAGADDYLFLHHGGPTATHPGPVRVGLDAHEPGAGDADGVDSHACSCLVCLVTLGESFAPWMPTPQPGHTLRPAAVVVSYASHLPGIFRPPIA